MPRVLMPGGGVPLRPLPVGVVPIGVAEKGRAGTPAQTAKIRPLGRRSLLTPELREWLERELAAGCPQAVAAQRAGIGLRSVERWLAEGRVRRPERTPRAMFASVWSAPRPKRHDWGYRAWMGRWTLALGPVLSWAGLALVAASIAGFIRNSDGALPLLGIAVCCVLLSLWLRDAR